MRISLRALPAILGLAFATTASAGPLTISSISGGFVNAVPAGTTIVNQAGSLVDTIRWGVPVNQSQSGYDFDPVDGAVNPILGTPFLLGTFTHLNQPVFQPWLDSVDYSLSLGTNGNPAGLADVFSFDHTETPNDGNCEPGPAGSVPSVSNCDDFVVISQLGINSLIDVGGDLYFFNLLGFSTNGGATIKNLFQSVEGGNNSAGLYGVVTLEPIRVPEPSLVALLAGGALAALRRRTRATR